MKTVFIRAIEAAVDEKASLIRATVRGRGACRRDVDISSFGQMPRSPFAYWTSDAIRECFAAHPPFEANGRTAKQGLATADDFRFVRLATEVQPQKRGTRWFPFAKGGSYSPFYADVYLVVDWADAGRNVYGYSKAFVRNPDFYFRPGLTWPLRTNGLSFRAMPDCSLFGHKGPAAFIDDNNPQSLLAFCAILNSGAFGALVAVQLARTELAQSFEVGLIQQTPVPTLRPQERSELAERAQRSWSLKRLLDTRTETSHAFLLPALLQVDGESIADRARSWAHVMAVTQSELDMLAAEIDAHAYRLYGISDKDRQLIEQGFGGSGDPEEVPSDDDVDGDGDEEATEADAVPTVASLFSWSVGVAFGRFDVRLATRERAAPSEPQPFDALPVCSPGMLTGDDGLPATGAPAGYLLPFPTDGILVDDPGHPRDLMRAVLSVFDMIFADADANARRHEATELLGSADLQTWFARDFFESHIKRYSKSRRKAPIYWQLATASGSYSVWIYIHRATSDTLFRILEPNFLGGKLDHEKAKLDGLTQEAGQNPSASARREIELQENFVNELSAFKAEISRVAPLWKPNLDDGVILNYAPLWRLVPQSRSWQGECKKAWDKLVSGDYDWAHLSMHLWPERVVLKCIDDRSLAIAHGLEGVFWHEDEPGVWCKNDVSEMTVKKLIAERTSTTVKAALKELLSAASPTASKAHKARGRSPSPRSAAPKSVPAITSTTAAEATIDGATLSAVKVAIASVADGASKADVLAATGLSDADWSKAIAALLDRGDVTRTGEKRGTRYRADAHGEDA